MFFKFLSGAVQTGTQALVVDKHMAVCYDVPRKAPPTRRAQSEHTEYFIRQTRRPTFNLEPHHQPIDLTQIPHVESNSQDAYEADDLRYALPV
jgi:hypothetical protein